MKTTESSVRSDIGSTDLKTLFVKDSTDIFQHFLFIMILIGLVMLRNVNYYVFHSLAETFSCFIAMGILIVSIHTNRISKNSFFMFLGIGYVFILIMDLFHTYSYGDLMMLSNDVYDMDTKFWIVSRGIELVTLLISFVFLFKKDVRTNNYVIFIVYFVFAGFIIYDIVYLQLFIPVMRTPEDGITNAKIYAEYIIAFGFFICCLIVFLARKNMDRSLFVMIEAALVCKVISELFFTLYGDVTDIYNMLGHIFKVGSYYFTYMGIIVNGLERPFEMININLNMADAAVIEKEKQKKCMEDIIMHNDQCYEWIIENSGNGIVILRDNKIIYANITAAKILGASSLTDILGIDQKEFLKNNYEDDIIKVYDFNNEFGFKEIEITNLKNECVDIEFSSENISYRGKPARLVILKDLGLKNEIELLKNDLIENEEQLLKSNEHNKIITEFFSNISHELKTPINVILSAVQLLMIKCVDDSSDYNEKSAKLLNVIKQNGYRLIRLVNNLLDMSKFDSGFLKLNLCNENIVSIVEDITLSVADYIKSKGVSIIFDTDVEELLMAVDCDKIERIILNLLSNAVKFTNNGDDIFVFVIDEEETVKISVKDTGVGIPEDKLKVIFDRFGQVEKTLIRNKEGTGIGLSLVKNLVEIHGGSISVNSKVGEGSEFIVELPVTLIDEKEEDMCSPYCSSGKVDNILVEFSDIYQ
ncbi:MAG: MASE3 domain-containing protein [Sedimentibacter saalensis]|jgi:signal transduction histidine kinase|uniref:MASE3 domain-containing sensor histidine kinase n=1 Tax=Sedimentibacter saalensis TaxID=130788 RepID=UPI002B216967|nr:MASE3 domain-containing protein [Sedimentibacter saalensis]MEA5094532.1 MASE3 domain-containing protein [Sedimentibacter saalensis]